MITYVPVSDPRVAEELRLAGLLYCGYPNPRIAGDPWDRSGVYGACRVWPKYFCYAVEE